jgi:hypothetical protein
MLLQDHCEAVLKASTREEFQAALVRFAQELGFGFMGASAVYDHPNARPVFVTAHNAPASYIPVMESELSRFDPVMQHCKHSGLPIAWDQSAYVRAGRGELWEEMAPHGYQTGISMALHLPHGRHFLFGVDGDRALPKQQKKLARMVADLASVLMFAQESAFRLLPSGHCNTCDGFQDALLTEPLQVASICLPGEYGDPSPVALSPHRRSATKRDHWGQKSTRRLPGLKARFHKPIH